MILGLSSDRYEPSFKGKHYKLRISVCLALYDASTEGNNRGLGLNELSKILKFPYESIAVSLTNWTNKFKKKYISKKPGYNSQGKPVNLYSITNKGIAYLNKIPKEIILECRRNMNGKEDPQ